MRLWANKRFWRRAAVIGSAAWILATIIIWMIDRNFTWEPHYGDAVGPATGAALFGVGLIFIVCWGIPWIANSIDP